MTPFAKRLAAITLTASVLAGAWAGAAAFSANAGTDQDPLVTLSYVEKRIQELTVDFNAQLTALKATVASQPAGGSTGGSQGTAIFEPVLVQQGQAVYFGAGTEFLVRNGKVTAIDAPKGGLADLTGGKDLTLGQLVAPNHHILVPRDDGRGVVAHEACWILIKGTYTIAQ